MKLPDHTPVSAAAARAIAERHGLGPGAFARLPDTGVINAIYLLGEEFVLRVPRDHPGHVAQARREAVAAPAARAAGVRTPRLLAFDDAGDLLPVPYMVYERVRGETLGLLDLEPGDTPAVWRELGRDLAQLHIGVRADGAAGQLRAGGPPADPRALAEERAADGWFTGLEARWLIAWLDRLAPAALAPAPRRFLHQDVQATNVMVGAAGREYRALLDWGCAGWGDPAQDFVAIPLRAVPFMLAGYRAVAPLDGDEGAEARVVWWRLQLILAVLPRGAAPGLSWGERPLAWLLDALRFFHDAPGGRWRDVGP